jgi:plastocyanin
MRMRLLAAGLTALLVGAVVVPAAAGSGTTKNVRVADYSFSPKKLTIKRNTRIKWSWSRRNIAPHNVTLVKGPKGIVKRKWHSQTGTHGISFARTFSKTGTYHFECTIHPFMKLTVVVTR